MKEENKSDKKKPDIIVIGSGESEKAALIQSIIAKYEAKKGVEVKVWELKNHNTSPMLILDDYKSLVPIADNLAESPVKLPEDINSKLPPHMLPSTFKVVNMLSNSLKVPESGKAQRRKRRKNERKLKKLKKC